MLESCGREMCEGPRYDPSTNEIGSTYMGDDKLCTEMQRKTLTGVKNDCACAKFE